MEKRDFVYHFTNIFLSEAVKETILIENWNEGRDFDPRYEEYLKFFFVMKDKYLSGKFSDDEIIVELTEKKEKLVENFNAKFQSEFVKEVMKRGSSKEIAVQLLPKGMFTRGNINTEAIKTFRKLEESLDNKKARRKQYGAR